MSFVCKFLLPLRISVITGCLPPRVHLTHIVFIILSEWANLLLCTWFVFIEMSLKRRRINSRTQFLSQVGSLIFTGTLLKPQNFEAKKSKKKSLLLLCWCLSQCRKTGISWADSHHRQRQLMTCGVSNPATLKASLTDCCIKASRWNCECIIIL